MLSAVAGTIALAEWLIFLPLFAMGSGDEGRFYRSAIGFGFLALPVAAICDFTAARRLPSRPGSARRLLAASAVLQLFVEGSVTFPLLIGGIVTVTAAALAFAGRPAPTAPPSP